MAASAAAAAGVNDGNNTRFTEQIMIRYPDSTDPFHLLLHLILLLSLLLLHPRVCRPPLTHVIPFRRAHPSLADSI